MKMPEPVWSMTYSATRRKHHHRCVCCRKIIKDGETVQMARTLGKKTRVMHDECAAAPWLDRWTGRDALEAWGMAYLAALGFREAKQFIETASICRVGGASECAS